MSVGRAEFDLLRAELLELKTEVLRLRARVADLEGECFEVVEGVEARQPSSSAAAVVEEVSSAVSREEVCRRVGAYLRRAVSGEHRGSSSRDLLLQASRYWIVVQSFEGRRFDPPRVFCKFGSCKQLVKKGSECGASVFVGLPAQSDVYLALEAGGFGRPSAFEQ